MRKKILAAAFAGALALSVAVPAFAAHKDGHEKFDICHNGHTISVSEQGADHHLDNHDTDTFGECDD